MTDIEPSAFVGSDLCHRSPISGIDALSERYVATAGYDSQVILWDARSGRALARTKHDHLVNQCRFSPDGRSLLTASSDYSARVWEVPSLKAQAVLLGHQDDVEMASWSPSGSHIATAARDYRIRIFERDGTHRRTITGHNADVLSVEWLGEGGGVVSSSDDGSVRRWDPASGRELERYSLGGETDTVVVASSGTIFAGNDRGEILTLREGTVSVLRCHHAGIKRLVLQEQHQRLMSASYDRTVKVWSIGIDGSLSLIQKVEAPAIVWLRSASFIGIDSIAFGTFGSRYATYSMSDRSWDIARVEETPGLNAGCVHEGASYTVGDAGIVRRDGEIVARLGSLCNFILPWGGRLVTGGQLGVLFDALTGQVLYRHHSPLNCGVSWAAKDRHLLAVGAYTGEGLVFEKFDNDSGRFLFRTTLHHNAIKGLACNGAHLFSVCADAAVAFHDTETLKPIGTIPDAHDKIANGAACLPDGRFVSVSRDRKMRFWEAASCQAIATPHDHSIKCVAVLGPAHCVATGSYDGKVAIYDWHRGEWPLIRKISSFGISSLAADKGAGEFLATSYDGCVYRVPAGVSLRA